MTILRTTILAAVAVVSGFATTINLSTGFDSSGNLLTTSGAADAHWVIEGSTLVANGSAAQVIESNSADWFGGWAADGPNSDWIAVNASIANQGNVPYMAEIQFFLPTASAVATASLSAATWGVDDDGFVQLNGKTISGPFHFNSNPGAINSFAGTNSGFVLGMNTLTITVDQTDNNLEAMRYQGSVSFSSLPEPGAGLLMISGLGVFLAVLRRRRI
jgi:hypothetical protein